MSLRLSNAILLHLFRLVNIIEPVILSRQDVDAHACNTGNS